MGRRMAWIVLCLGVAITSGCASWCDDLQDICDRCTTPTTRDACQEIVDEADEDTCEGSIDFYEDYC